MNRMDKEYKVLHIFSGYGGGISSLIQNLICNKTNGFDFDTLAFSYNGGDSFVEELEKNNCKTFTMPSPKREGILPFYSYLKALFNANKYDAVHCHIAGWFAIPFALIAKISGVKTFIVHAHSTEYENKWNRGIILRIINCLINFFIATDYFTCSDLAAEFTFGKFFLAKRKAVLIPNGINVSRFAKRVDNSYFENYKKLFGIIDNQIILSHIGRFNTQKNHMFIIKLAEKLQEKNIEFVILLVGDGELMSIVKEEVCRNNLHDRILFLGRRTDIPELIQFSSCMILPSFFEGLPTVSIECQACGTPIIMADTITKQSDMGLGLTHYCSLEKPEEWINTIVACSNSKYDIDDCITKIEDNGFSAISAGKFYCSVLKRIIDNQR